MNLKKEAGAEAAWNRIDSILRHPLYQKCINANEEAEADRCFCRHNMGHFLDVARIARIMNLEEGIAADTELIYAAALLHDIGRYLQYRDGTPHEKAGAAIAPAILEDCGFTEAEREEILGAIFSHRDASVAEEKSLRGLLYRADKASRPCFACKAEPDCDWKAEKKNLRLKY